MMVIMVAPVVLLCGRTESQRPEPLRNVPTRALRTRPLNPLRVVLEHFFQGGSHVWIGEDRSR
jgi:hypothetical protein